MIAEKTGNEGASYHLPGLQGVHSKQKRETLSTWDVFKKAANHSPGGFIAPVFSSVVVVLVAEFGISSLGHSLFQVHIHHPIYIGITLGQYCWLNHTI